jgi:hypothetical protein
MPDTSHCCCDPPTLDECYLCFTLRLPTGTTVPPCLFTVKITDLATSEVLLDDELDITGGIGNIDFWNVPDFWGGCIRVPPGEYLIEVTQGEANPDAYALPPYQPAPTLGASFVGSWSATVNHECETEWPAGTIIDVNGAVFVQATSLVNCKDTIAVAGHELSLTGPGGATTASGDDWLWAGLLTTTPGDYEACASAPEHVTECVTGYFAGNGTPPIGIALELIAARYCCGPAIGGYDNWVAPKKWLFSCRYGTVLIDLADFGDPAWTPEGWIFTFMETAESSGVGDPPNPQCCFGDDWEPGDPCIGPPINVPFVFPGLAPPSPVTYKVFIGCNDVSCQKTVAYRWIVELVTDAYGNPCGWAPTDIKYAGQEEGVGLRSYVPATAGGATSLPDDRPAGSYNIEIDMGQTIRTAWTVAGAAAFQDHFSWCPPCPGDYGVWAIPGDETVSLTPIWD